MVHFSFIENSKSRKPAFVMAIRSRQSILFGSPLILVSSLLLSTMTSQYCEASNHNMGSISTRLDTSAEEQRESDRMARHSVAAVEKPMDMSNDGDPAVRTDDRAMDSTMIGVFRIHDDALQVSSNSSQQLCVYKIVTQTGKQDGAGTDSDISLHLSNRDGDEVYFRGMTNGHRTFERGHTDTFILGGRPCVSDICKMILGTDEYGSFSEWFVVSVGFSLVLLQDNAPGPLLKETRWEINEWLPKESEAKELYIIRDDCNP